ncbi:MAG: ABC transporter substrate-binding protein, partial [Nitrososphaeraceae archaeon]
MIKLQATKFAITLAVIIIVAAAITPIKSLVFAQSASTTTNSSTGAGSNTNSVKTLRIGYFPNINHAQAVIGLGNGAFQKTLGKNVNVQTTVFNAGPSAIEALVAKKIDVTYVGPNPAINGYVVSDGKDL